MAYVSQDKKKKIAAALKALKMPKDFKYSLRVDNHSSLVVTISRAPATMIDDFIGHHPKAFEQESSNVLEANGYTQINTYYVERQFQGESLKLIEKMISTIKEAGEWFDKSDAMSDYFHTAFYLDVNIGRWDKPCEFVGERSAGQVEQVDDDALEAAEPAADTSEPKIYLVRGTVTKTEYMNDSEKTFEDMQIVYAASEKEADAKWEKYWNDKTSEYSVYYRAYAISASEAIT